MEEEYYLEDVRRTEKTFVSKKKKIFSKFFILDFLHTPSNKPILVVSKKMGSAVVRNKFKRRVRAALRELSCQTFNFKIIPKAPIKEITFKDCTFDLSKILKR